MATVTGFTAERMLVIENETVVDGEVQGDNLLLARRDGVQIDAGNVRGPKGDKGDTGTPGVITSVNDISTPSVYSPRVFQNKIAIDDWSTAPNGSIAIALDTGIIWEKDNTGVWFIVNSPLPPPTTSSTIQSYTDPFGEVWIAKSTVHAGAWKRARDVLHARWWRNAGGTLTTTHTVIGFDTMNFDAYGILVSQRHFLIPIPGIYHFENMVTGVPPTAGVYVQAIVQINGVLIKANNVYSQGVNNSDTASVSDLLKLNSGDQVTTSARCGSATCTVTPGSGNTSMSISYNGTG
jgi:hypothetical protein